MFRDSFASLRMTNSYVAHTSLRTISARQAGRRLQKTHFDFADIQIQSFTRHAEEGIRWIG